MPIVNTKSINNTDSLQLMSTQLSFETQSQLLPINTQEISNQLKSYTQTSLMFQQSQEKYGYAETLPQKLQITNEKK